MLEGSHRCPTAMGQCGLPSPARELQPWWAGRCLNDNSSEPCQVHFQITGPCIFRCFYYFKRITNTIPQKSTWKISASNLVAEGKFSPSSCNYFLTLSPLFHLLNYAELFSLLFSKNASSVQCRNIYYLLSSYLLTFFSFQERKENGSAVSSVNTASSYSWTKQMLPDFKPVYIKAQWIYMTCIKAWSNKQLQSLLLFPLSINLQQVSPGSTARCWFVIKYILNV